MDMPKDESEWKKKLTPEQYAVLRGKATDPPFSGVLVNNHETGVYMCAACGAMLFNSGTKFDSGSGWPSFYDAVNREAVELHEDTSHGIKRIEVICKKCKSHLGHLFDDANDQPTGMRYCINSTSLTFLPKK